jgi:signal transduction histidine kinase
MTRTAHAIGTSADFSSRLDEPPQADELGRLAHTFNDMLGQLDEAMKTQRRFLADASHELRSPLTAIRMNTEALLRGADADPAEREETLRAIARETDRMGRLVADLLALARADAGQPIEHRRVSLDALLLDVYQQERRLADGVHLTLGDLEQVEVDGDPDRLKQLLLNLVDNALRYTPCGGTVTLSVTGDGGRRPAAGAPSLPSPVRRPPSAVVTVADTGAGIAPEHLPRVFDRFYRADPPRTRKTGGTGLGLAICKWVAEAHGGRIEVESRPGEGSTFRVYLPIAGRVSGPSADGQGTTGRVRTLASSA